MKHYTEQEWLSYIGNLLPTDERTAYENHLYTCETCLNLYMECAAQGLEASEIIETEEWTEQVMKALQLQKSVQKSVQKPIQEPARPRSRALIRKPLFQYAVAAAITFVLMTTGVFHDFSTHIGKLQTDTHQVQGSSYTDQLMNKTVTLLDAIQLQPKADLNEKGGKKGE